MPMNNSEPKDNFGRNLYWFTLIAALAALAISFCIPADAAPARSALRPLETEMLRIAQTAQGTTQPAQTGVRDVSWTELQQEIASNRGAIVIESSRGDHQTMRLPVVVSLGERAAVELRLPRQARAQSGRLWLTVQSDDGSKVSARATLLRGGQVVSLLSEEGGLFARAAAGVWLLRVEAAGYLSREQTVVLSDGGEQRLQLLLLRRSASPKVQLGSREIALAGALTFATGSTGLSGDSERILDEVVDLLIHHPEVTLLRVEHQADLSLSDVVLLEQQAIAVRDYLVQHGISPERVVASVVEGPRRTAAKIVLRLASAGDR